MLGGRLIGLCSRIWMVVVDVRAAEADGAAVSRGAIDQVVLRRESTAAVILGGARCVAAILCRLERHEFERGRVLGGVVGRTMTDCYCAISPAVGASEFGAVFELVERLVPWRLSPLVITVRIGFGVASAQHAEAEAKSARVSIVAFVETFRGCGSVVGWLRVLSGAVGRGGGGSSGATVCELCVLGEGDALALWGARVGTVYGPEAVCVESIDGTTVKFELARLASEFTAARVGGLEVFGIVQVLVVDADDTRVSRVGGEGYAGRGLAGPSRWRHYEAEVAAQCVSARKPFTE